MSLTWPRTQLVAANNVFFVWCRRSRTGRYDTGHDLRGVRATRLHVSDDRFSDLTFLGFELWSRVVTRAKRRSSGARNHLRVGIRETRLRCRSWAGHDRSIGLIVART
jgi:hypothetical protein